MKTLLVGINSKFIHSNLAIRYIQVYGRQKGMELHTSEYTINQSVDYILDEIVVQGPEAVVFSCYIWNIDYVRRLVGMLRKVLPETVIICGGPEVSYEDIMWLETVPEIDIIIRGEGEASTVALIEALTDEKAEMTSLKGITYRIGDDIQRNPQGQAMDMAQIPFPYEQELKGLEHRILYYETSRGCPYSCEYCLSSIEKGVRFRPLDMVYNELQFFLDHQVKQVKFVDRTFNARKDHAMGIWRYLKDHDNGITNFHFELTADLLDDEMLAMLETLRVGLVQFEVGVQSTNEATIVDINRKTDFEKLKDRVLRIKEYENIHLHLDLIAGLPNENYQSFGTSFDDVMAIRPEQLQLGFLKVLKGSMIHHKRHEYGIVYRDFAPYEVLSTKDMTYLEMRKLKQLEEVLEIYYNSEQFVSTVEYMMTVHERPFAFFEALAEYFDQMGHFQQKHTRIRLFEILYDFGMKLAGSDMLDADFVRELLVHDLCSKEKPKKWPSFITVEDGTPDDIKAFYRAEDNVARYFGAYTGKSARQIQRMTHMQSYDYDIMEFENNGSVVKLNQQASYLYDYMKKDPMTGICKPTKVNL